MSIPITNGDDNQFYPTPPELAAKMFAGVNLNKVKTVLEPSAGKGNLIEAFGEAAFALRKVMKSYPNRTAESRQYRRRLPASEV